MHVHACDFPIMVIRRAQSASCAGTVQYCLTKKAYLRGSPALCLLSSCTLHNWRLASWPIKLRGQGALKFNLRIQDDKHPMIMSMQPRLQLNMHLLCHNDGIALIHSLLALS